MYKYNIEHELFNRLDILKTEQWTNKKKQLVVKQSIFVVSSNNFSKKSKDTTKIMKYRIVSC